MGEGEVVEIDGIMKIHPKYGEQLVANKVSLKKPTTTEQIERYLSSGLISGVGPVTAANIVLRFKEQTMNIIENDPKKLASIKGISENKAMEIHHTVWTSSIGSLLCTYAFKFLYTVQGAPDGYSYAGSDAKRPFCPFGKASLLVL